MKWCTYIIELSDHSYYTGITNDLEKRLEKHSKGKGSRYVCQRLPIVAVVYVEYANNRSEASIRESQIKKLSRAKKEELFNIKG